MLLHTSSSIYIHTYIILNISIYLYLYLYISHGSGPASLESLTVLYTQQVHTPDVCYNLMCCPWSWGSSEGAWKAVSHIAQTSFRSSVSGSLEGHATLILIFYSSRKPAFRHGLYGISESPSGEYPHGLSNWSGELLPENGVASALFIVTLWSHNNDMSPSAPGNSLCRWHKMNIRLWL